uniref:Peptidase_M13 domain-containing protein n=1 Tax=Strongyloides papillosus TaxID=174720 RepID=A0A0N5C7W0_STREA
MKFERNFDMYNISKVELMEDCYEKTGIFNYVSIEEILEAIKLQKESSLKSKEDLTSCGGKIFQSEKLLSTYVKSNAWYDHLKNTFNINLDTLNEPLFIVHFLNSHNYGFFGYTIASQMMHDFDNYKRTVVPPYPRFLSGTNLPRIRGDNCILESDNKNKLNVTLWSIKNFEEKSKCFVEQYDMEKESRTNKSINISKTLARTIAYNGGLKIAHTVYMKYLQSFGGEESKYPGFENFNCEQLFFIAAGRRSCEYISEDILKEVIDKEEIVPQEIATNVALSNYKPFYDAFKCPVNSKMNLEDKCELWKNQLQN